MSKYYSMRVKTQENRVNKGFIGETFNNMESVG